MRTRIIKELIGWLRRNNGALPRELYVPITWVVAVRLFLDELDVPITVLSDPLLNSQEFRFSW